MPYLYQFDIHHIFPRELFREFVDPIDQNSPRIGEALASIFQGHTVSISLDMQANKIGLFSLPGTIAKLSTLVGEGFGTSKHGFHSAYNNFLIEQIRAVLTSTSLDAPAKSAAVLDLHYFATELATGSIMDANGQPVQVTGDLASIQFGWSSFQSGLADATSSVAIDRDGYLSDLAQHQTFTDAGVTSNYEQRVVFHEALLDARFAAGDLTQAQYDHFSGMLDAASAALTSNGFQQGYWTNQLSSIGVQANYAAAINNNIPVSNIDTFLNGFAQALSAIPEFLASESGAVSVPSFDAMMGTMTSFANNMSQIVGELPTNLSDLGLGALNSMVSSFGAMTVGIGGGFIGDTAEFLNMSYGALKIGFATGDWSDFGAAALQYGVGLVFSAALIGGTVALAGLAGPAAAAAAATLWAGYGLYDGWVNIAELAGKILNDIGSLAEENPHWLSDLIAQWNPAAIDPLVIDLDGDGIELTALGSSAVRFDLDGDGFAERTAWVAPDDGLLTTDRNGNGRIDDISELFGSPNATGYQKLAEFDSNGNGIVNAQDANFSQLRVWRDIDGDGQSDAGELQTLTEAGISSLSVNPVPSSLSVNGNRVIETATVTMADGTTTQSGEVLFNLSQVETSYIMPEDFTYDSEVFTLPTLRGFGEIADLWVAMSEDTTLKQDARGLIATARAGNFQGFKVNFDGFLANWANVEDAVWWQHSGLEIYFAYDHDHLHDLYDWKVFHPDLIIDGVLYPAAPYPGPLPSAKGFYFGPGGGISSVYSFDPDEYSAWISDNNLEIAFDLNTSSEFWGFVMTTYQSPSVVVQGSSNGRTYRLEPQEFGDTSGAPEMNATDFAFLEKLMGQDYRVGTNYFAPDSVIVTTPEEDQVDDLKASYNDVKDYMMARFLAQAALSILETEGNSADLGALAPFRHIFYNPFEDKVVGDIQSLASELITDFRSDPLGTDADALDLLRLFVPDFKYMGAYVAAEFPDLDRALLAAALDTGQLLEGTVLNETLSLTQPGTAIGYGGDDILSGSSGVDVLMGGAGNDTMSGGAGGDFYLIGKDEGNDRIRETGGSDDTIRFASGTALADLLAVFSNSDGDEHIDLTFSFANGSGSFTIEDMLSQTPTAYSGVQTASQIELFEFADGTRLSRADFLRLTYFAGTAGNDDIRGTYFNDTIAGGAGNDVLQGGEGNDTYLVDPGQGDDRIVEGGGANDTIRFAAGITLADIRAVASNADGDAHTDLTFSFANGSGSFTIEDMLSQGPSWATNIHLTSQIEWFEFADGSRLSRAEFLRQTYFAGTAGADEIHGTFFDDTLTGGTGNDTLRGGEGNDTYLVDPGQGDDRIVEGGGANDTIRFAAGITLADIRAVASNADGDAHTDLTFSFANGSGSFTIEDMLSQGPSWATNIHLTSQIEWFEFADGSRLSRVEFLRQTYFAGTAGADEIHGTFFDDTLTGGSGNDTLRGGEGNDLYLVDKNQGTKLIVEGGGANDTIRFAAGITLTDIRAVASNADGDAHTDLTFSFANGSGSFTIEDMLSQGPSWATNIHLTSQIEWFEFADGSRLSRAEFLRQTYFAGTAGADEIHGTFFDDTLTGGSGNDTLRGGEGNDLYLVDKNQGTKLIVEGGGTNDTIRFAAGITLTDIRAVASNADGDAHTDLTFSFANGSGSFTIEDMLSQTSTAYSGIQTASQIEWFEFADGTRLSRADFLRLTYFAGTAGNDDIRGTYFNDTIAGGAGNDVLQGGAGDDTYLVDLDQGDDRIVEGGGANDTIRFAAGIMLSDLRAVVTNIDGDSHPDLTFSFASAGGSFTIEDMLSQVSWVYTNIQTISQIEWFEFADGARLSRAEFLRQTYFAGTPGNDTLSGTYFDDVMSGGAGDDILSGGEGADGLTGGAGHDLLDGGAGNDSMAGGAGNDIYVVDSAADAVIEAADDGTDLVQSSVTVTLAAEVENLILTGNGVINGTGNDLANRLTGNSAANTLSGGAGTDSLYGGGGNDILTGGIDADRFIFNAASSGVDTITDFNGLDGGGDEFDVLEFQGLLIGSFAYLGSSAFTGGSDNTEARVSGNQVLVDADGNGTADITITLSGLTSASQIGAEDFLFT